jgi:hypothetical protein
VALEVRLDGTNEPTDFSKESVDIEIRHGEESGPPGIEGLAESLCRSVRPPIAPPGA